jgi:hypothetical protein
MTLTSYARPTLNTSVVGKSVLRESVGNLRSTLSNAAAVSVGRFRSGHREIIDEFVKSINEGSEPPVTPESAATTVRVLEEVVQQLESQKGFGV